MTTRRGQIPVMRGDDVFREFVRRYGPAAALMDPDSPSAHRDLEHVVGYGVRQHRLKTPNHAQCCPGAPRTRTRSSNRDHEGDQHDHEGEPDDSGDALSAPSAQVAMHPGDRIVRECEVGHLRVETVAQFVLEFFVSDHVAPRGAVGGSTSNSRSYAVALAVVDFTVPSLIPSTPAVSTTDRSTKNLRTMTSRWARLSCPSTTIEDVAIHHRV